MAELFIKDSKLTAFEDWKATVEGLKQSLPEATRESLKQSIIKAIKQRIPNEEFGLFFSGGVDSTTIALILKQLNADFVCYTVGVEGAQDLEVADKVAKELNLNHKSKTLTLNEVKDCMKQAKDLIPKELLEKENTAVLLGVAAVEIAAIELAKQDNITYFFGGLGSEEIFAGYQRHVKSENINEECWNGMVNMYQRDLIRDCTVAAHFNATFATPFLDKQVIQHAMALEEPKVNSEFKKLPIRYIAEELGLPKEFAWRKKKAAQYGSKFDNALEKLTKQDNKQFKRDFIADL